VLDSSAQTGRDRAGWIYLIKEKNGPNYKIGRTKDYNDRLGTFEVKLPFEIDPLVVIQTEDMYRLESQLHKKFAAKHINGEWFRLHRRDVDFILHIGK